jgi:predicted ATP-grasp superfamily ATP-dependent carboligase
MQVKLAVEKIKAQLAVKRFIVQEFVVGESASVSLIVADDKALPISLNKQNVNVAQPMQNSSYNGGVVPLNHPLKEEAFVAAQKAVECFAGLRGYVGVDVILTKNKPFVMDVNPRLTTSYVGLSQTANFNVAQALVNAVLKNELPSKHELNGFTCFSKVETPKPSINAFQKASQMADVVSPPFPLDDNSKATALGACKGESLKEADLHLDEAKKRLLNIVSRGK